MSPCGVTILICDTTSSGVTGLTFGHNAKKALLLLVNKLDVSKLSEPATTIETMGDVYTVTYTNGSCETVVPLTHWH
jgi:hypothetical protein